MSWPTKKVVPSPPLVCIELNPGPQKLDVGKRNQVIGFLELEVPLPESYNQKGSSIAKKFLEPRGI